MARPIHLSCDELRRLYLDGGQGVAQIAAAAGCSASSISIRLRRCGIPTRSGRFRRADVPMDLLEQLYLREALPLRAIAARMGVSVGTVSNRLRAYGIPRRSRRALAAAAATQAPAGMSLSR